MLNTQVGSTIMLDRRSFGEVADEVSYVPHHSQKIAFTFAGMRKFARRLEGAGWTVAYSRLDGPDNTGSIPGELIRRTAQYDAVGVVYTEPGEWRLMNV